MTEPNPTKTAFAKWWISGSVEFERNHHPNLRTRYDLAVAGWHAAFLSLGLTPERLHELERQYFEALGNRD